MILLRTKDFFNWHNKSDFTFLNFFYLLDPKIKIFHKYFLDTKTPKSSQCVSECTNASEWIYLGWYSYMSIRINVMLFCTFWAMRTTKFIVSNLLSMYHFEIEGEKKSFIHIYLINIWQMSWWSHNLNHDQTKRPTENFISQNLLKIH